MRRRIEALSRRESIYLVDGWLNRLESLMERGDEVVPEPLFREINRFVGRLDLDLYRPLRAETHETSRLLALLFKAQTYLLTRLGATA